MAIFSRPSEVVVSHPSPRFSGRPKAGTTVGAHTVGRATQRGKMLAEFATGRNGAPSNEP